MSIGKRIKSLREQKQMTLDEVAKMCNTTRQTIYKYENEIVTKIPYDRIWLLAKALGTTPSVLFDWEDSNENYRSNITDDEYSIILKYRTLDEYGQQNVNAILNNEYARCQDAKVITLKEDKSPYKIHTLAAHEKVGASEEDKQKDYDLMNDPSIWGDKA